MLNQLRLIPGAILALCIYALIGIWDLTSRLQWSVMVDANPLLMDEYYVIFKRPPDGVKQMMHDWLIKPQIEAQQKLAAQKASVNNVSSGQTKPRSLPTGKQEVLAVGSFDYRLTAVFEDTQKALKFAVFMKSSKGNKHLDTIHLKEAESFEGYTVTNINLSSVILQAEDGRVVELMLFKKDQ